MKIQNIYIFYVALILSFASRAQLVLNNGVFINVNGGTSNNASANFVLNNPPATPITRAGTSSSGPTGGMILESEWNRLVYYLSNGTTAITVPYVSNTTGSYVQFPLAFYGITAGVNSGSKGAIRFSSTHSGALASGWDNFASYMPSKVLNMNGSGCAGDNSANAIDRFWIIEPVYYTTRPAVTLDFTYLMGEANTNGGNTASLYSTLQPQRYDTTVAAACAWNGFPTTAAEFGTNAPGACCGNNTGTLTGVQVSAANFFPDWTLANYLIPLPVSIVSFSGACENTTVTLKWISVNEVNLKNYLIEKSSDGVNFMPLTTVAANGSTKQSNNQNTTYNYVDVSPGDNSTMYYRLSYSDVNGKTTNFKIVTINGCNTKNTENGTIYSYDGSVNVGLFSLSNQNFSITAYDVTGRLILEKQLSAAEGNNTYKFNPGLAQGIYLFEMKTNQLTIVKRILIEN